MKQIIRLAWSYLKYYRKQTMALFLGIVLSSVYRNRFTSKERKSCSKRKCPHKIRRLALYDAL